MKLIEGIIPPIITPLKNNKQLDVKGLENLIEHIISGGVHGLFVLGTTGEATNLSYTLRKEIIKKTSEIVSGRVPVLIGITDTSVMDSIEIAEFAKLCNADAVVISAPYYLPISQQEMVDYLKYLVPQLSLPFMMYNMPSCTKLHMTLETIEAARKLGAIGLKDSSGDWSYLKSAIEKFKEFPDFSILCGTEIQLPETMAAGGNGAVAGGANMFPQLYVDFYEASKKQDAKKLKELLNKIEQVNELFYSVGKESSKYIKSIKAVLAEMGICEGFVAQPFSRFTANEQEQIRKNLLEFNSKL